MSIVPKTSCPVVAVLFATMVLVRVRAPVLMIPPPDVVALPYATVERSRVSKAVPEVPLLKIDPP